MVSANPFKHITNPLNRFKQQEFSPLAGASAGKIGNKHDKDCKENEKKKERELIAQLSIAEDENLALISANFMETLHNKLEAVEAMQNDGIIETAEALPQSVEISVVIERDGVMSNALHSAPKVKQIGAYERNKGFGDVDVCQKMHAAFKDLAHQAYSKGSSKMVIVTQCTMPDGEVKITKIEIKAELDLHKEEDNVNISQEDLIARRGHVYFHSGGMEGTKRLGYDSMAHVVKHVLDDVLFHSNLFTEGADYHDGRTFEEERFPEDKQNMSFSAKEVAEGDDALAANVSRGNDKRSKRLRDAVAGGEAKRRRDAAEVLRINARGPVTQKGDALKLMRDMGGEDGILYKHMHAHQDDHLEMCLGQERVLDFMLEHPEVVDGFDQVPAERWMQSDEAGEHLRESYVVEREYQTIIDREERGKTRAYVHHDPVPLGEEFGSNISGTSWVTCNEDLSYIDDLSENSASEDDDIRGGGAPRGRMDGRLDRRSSMSSGSMSSVDREDHLGGGVLHRDRSRSLDDVGDDDPEGIRPRDDAEGLRRHDSSMRINGLDGSTSEV